MPKNENIKKVLVVGSGPITIGQAAEFDYSGTQACQALKEEGIEVVLINSNPATIMTDREIANKVYVEPINIDIVEKIIIKEKPDSLLATMGGQTGLNLALDLHEKGILEKYNLSIIGTPIEAIIEGEDRESFKNLMEKINQPIIESQAIKTLEEGLEFVLEIGYPVIVRPAYTLGGTGGGIADNEEQLRDILKQGLHLSPVGQVLLEKSIKGWKEVEYEVMRDGFGNCITVCNMENVDPVGIHTGDSIVVAPSQTLSDKEYQMLRSASIDIINAIGIEGGCNVQFALNPQSFEYAVIEINPRVSRSSALASKATGYPIAKVAAKIALGYGLDEIKNAVTQKTVACFEPTIDYVVAKIPKWPFDKFNNADRTLGTKMMATGEVMAIGSNFEEALLKGVRSLEIGQYNLYSKEIATMDIQELKNRVVIPDDERIFYLAELIRRFYHIEKVCSITGVDRFFVEKIKWIVMQEEELRESSLEDLTKDKLLMLKKKGFSDKGIADLLGVKPREIYGLRKSFGILPSYNMVDTCGGEFEAISPYYYSTYGTYDEVEVTNREKVIVIGSGPIRIGQGIEFDYCSVHSVKALKELDIETIIINNNPETVSTDFDISDKLYFEPLTEEDVLNVIEKEKPTGVILQFGGQTAIKLANFLMEEGINILGTHPKDMDRAEDREKFEELLEDLSINRPKGRAVRSLEEGNKIAQELGFPLLVRPSYVLGGQGMEITYTQKDFVHYLEKAFKNDKKNPVLVDKYLMGREIEVDAISDGEDVLIPGIMEHLERAGVHSGDSITVYPGQNINEELKDKILSYTRSIAKGLNIVGVVNIQFIEFENELYILEVNPRASRTVPYISKVSGLPIIELATKAMTGKSLVSLGYNYGIYGEPDYIAIKVPVFSTHKLPNVEISLGPEMKSTGEVLGIGRTIEEALYKGFLAAGMNLDVKHKRMLATIKNQDKDEFLELAKRLSVLGYEFIATEGTADILNKEQIKTSTVAKIQNGKPDILDVIRTEELDFIINTPTKGNDAKRDGFRIRRIATESGVNVITSLDTLRAIVKVMESGIDIEDVEVIHI